MKNITKIIIIIIIILLIGFILYILIKPKSNENFKIDNKKNPFNSIFLIEFSKSKPDIIEYKLLHKKQKEHMKNKSKVEKYIYEGLDGENNNSGVNERLNTFLENAEAAANDEDRVAQRELRFKTFGIPNTILGDVDGLKVRELITNTLGDIPDQLSSYLYKFLQTNKKKDVMIDILRYVGITAISMTLAALGLGPLSSLFTGFLPSEEDTSLNLANIEKSLTNSLYKERFLTLVMNMNLNLQKIKYYMATVYIPLKVKYYNSCNFDEESYTVDDIINCMKEDNYDPNIIKKDSYQNNTKREILNLSLKEMDRLLYSECTSIYSDIQELASNYNFGDSIEVAKLIHNINVQLILIEISYFQEKALADDFHRNSTIVTDINEKIKKMLNNISGDEQKKNEILSLILPSCKTSNYYYINPWLSRNIGNINITGNVSQNSGLLQFLQKRCKEYFELIQKIIQLYYNNMEFYNDCGNTDYIRWVDHYDENVLLEGKIIHYKGEYKSKDARTNYKTRIIGNITNSVHFTLKKDLYTGDIREKSWWERRNECALRTNYYTFINKNSENGDEDYRLPLPDTKSRFNIGTDTKRQAIISDISYYYEEDESPDTKENKMFYNNRKCGCLIDFVNSMKFDEILKNFMNTCGIEDLPTFKNYFRKVEDVLMSMDIIKYQEIYNKWKDFKIQYYEYDSERLNEMDLIPADPKNIQAIYALKNLPLYYLNCVFNRESIFINADLRIKDLIDTILKYESEKIKYDYNKSYPFGKRYGSYELARQQYNNFKNYNYNFSAENIKNFGTYCSNPVMLTEKFNKNLEIKIPDNYPGTNKNIFCKKGNSIVTCSNSFMSPGIEGTDYSRNRQIICYNEFKGTSIKDRDLLEKFLKMFDVDNKAYEIGISQNKNIYDISSIINTQTKLMIPDYVDFKVDKPVTSKSIADISFENIQKQYFQIPNSKSKFIKLNLDLDEKNIQQFLNLKDLLKPIKPTESFTERDKDFYIRNYDYLNNRKNYYSQLETKDDKINDLLFIQSLLNSKLFFSFEYNGKPYYFDIQNGYIIYLDKDIDLIKNIIKLESEYTNYNKLKLCKNNIQKLIDKKVSKSDYDNSSKTKTEIGAIKVELNSINNDIKSLVTGKYIKFANNDIDSYIVKLTEMDTEINSKPNSYAKYFDKIYELKNNINKTLQEFLINSETNTNEKLQNEIIKAYIKYINDSQLIKCNRYYSVKNENLQDYVVIKQPNDLAFTDYVILQKKSNGNLIFYDLKNNNFVDNLSTINNIDNIVKELNNNLNIPLNLNIEKPQPLPQSTPNPQSNNPLLPPNNKLKYSNISDNMNLTDDIPPFNKQNYFEFYSPNYYHYKL